MKTKIDVNSKVNKKSFYLFNDTEKVFEMLTDEEAGKLIKHLFSYVNDKESKLNDRLLEVAFEPIRLQLERDKKRYESVCERNRENGLKGGRPRKKRNPNNPVGLLETQNNPKEPKKADTDTDTVKDTKTKTGSIDDLFSNENVLLKPIVSEWIAYKKEIKDPYKTVRGMKAFVKELQKLSNNDPKVAKEITERSMANNWKGIFELNNNGNGNGKTTPTRRAIEILE